MIKKSRKPVRKKVSAKTNGKSNVDKILVENFVALQKVMTNLSLKFDGLTSQISKLLELFEISAKNLAHKDFTNEKGNKNNKEMMIKLDELVGQNKTIARGLTLMHESNSPRLKKPESPKDLAGRDGHEKPRRQPVGETGEYQKSISSNQKDAVQKP